MPAAHPVYLSVEEEAALHRRIDRLTLHAGRLEEGEAPSVIAPPVLDRFLVAVGDDPRQDLALAWANELAPWFAKHVTLAHVDSRSHDVYYAGVYRSYFPPHVEEERGRESFSRLDEARRLMGDVGNVGVAWFEGTRVKQLVHAAEKGRAHLVLVGSRPSTGLGRWLLRGTAQGVKDHAPCSVLLAKGAPLPGDVLCAVDGSWSSKRAASLAYRIARAWGSTLRVLHVLRPPAAGTELEFVASESALLAELQLPWGEPAGVEYAFRVGEVGLIVVDDAVRTAPALLVLGSRGLGGLRSLVAGSVTNYVAHHSETSMIIVK